MTILKNTKTMTNEEKTEEFVRKQTINDVCEWLKENAWVDDNMYVFDIEELKEAMKEIAPKYVYHPKTKDELIEAIEKEIEAQGPTADLNCIDTSDITDMSLLFDNDLNKYAKGFNGNISGWNVSKVTNMNNMFYDCKKFNQDISNWNVSNVEYMHCMFCGCESLNQDLSKWNTINVIDMSYMFCWCNKFNQDLSKWNTINVIDMSYMFCWCNKFNQDLSKWNTINVTNMRCMFYGCEAFNQDLSKWNTINVIDMSYMFDGCSIKEEYKPKLKN